MSTHFNNNDSPSVQTSASELDINKLFEGFNNDPSFKSELQTASVLLIPSDLKPEYEGPVFPTSTREVFGRLSRELDGQAIVNATVKDEDYFEFEYRSEDILLPIIFVANSVLLPLVITVLGSFLYDCLKRPNGEKAEGTVKSELHFVTGDEEQLHFKYEGPADTFERIALQKLQDTGVEVNEGGEETCKKKN